ncbi:response regulator transcription factor [Planobispora longispora]|uniref:DNA-binding response regulator n=1 Tax=Planobispora longispora TaxID=28887 RepID=A0A8J3W9Z8_9ACTN|nr:response regulator transcription factor [Planobispora longispora]GIH81302.1 DNA-binding response regulator [Planobispora longispora]
MRVMLCDDSALFRRGVALLLEGVGVEVTGQARDVAELTTLMRGHLPDAVILGIRMPPTFTDEGLTGAAELRAAHPRLGVLVLSTYAETAYAQRLLEIGPRGVGYLLKDRVDDAAAIRDALTRVIDGESVVDGEIISRLFARKAASPLDRLTERERSVLTLMAEGRSNQAISRRLHLGVKTVEGHIAAIFAKLDLESAPDDNRRVLAVLAWTQSAAQRRPGGPGS